MSNFDIFNLGVKDIPTGNEEKKESVFYRPSADKGGKDGIYRALIRFLPNPVNPQKSLVRKFVYWLEDAEGNAAYYDCPSTVGDKSPIQDTFFKLRKSESAADQKMAEKLKRREVYYSLVQIIKDPNDPELDGKIKIFKFGYKIKQKIDEELTPQFDEPTQVFDLYNGKNFELTISKQGGFNNYDSSKFQGSKSRIKLNGEELGNTEADKANMLEYLNSAPKLDEVEYKPWDDETRAKVHSILNQFRSPGDAIETITNTSSQVNDDIDTMVTPKPVANEPQVSAPVEQPAASNATEDDLDSFLDNLEL